MARRPSTTPTAEPQHTHTPLSAMTKQQASTSFEQQPHQPARAQSHHSMSVQEQEQQRLPEKRNC